MRSMSRLERRHWARARSLEDVAELTAQWLEGSLASQPGYQPRCGPDTETLDLVDTLAAINRAGWLTRGSQPGWGPGVEDDGALWCQRAAVEGVARPQLAERVRAAATDAGLLVMTYPGACRRRPQRSGVIVTTRNNQAVTGFGDQRTIRTLADHYLECHRDAVTDIIDATQLTVVDPEWGRNDRLWPLLDRLATPAPAHRR